MRTPTFVLLAITAALLLGVPGCGDEGGETTDPSAAGGYGESGYAAGAGGPATMDPALRERAEKALDEARALLLSAQTEEGGIGDEAAGIPANVGYTGLALAAITAATPRTQVKGDEAIRRGLQWLADHQKEDGSIYDNPAVVNYMTSAAVGAFAAAKIREFLPVEVKGRDFLARSQIAGDEADPSYGGFPYKQDQGQPADLSNFQFALTALADAGLPEDHVVWERALVYLQRVQNRSEGNDYTAEVEIDGETVKAVSGDDGGAAYYPMNSKAGYVERPDGTVEPRSYGSMTYALLKCLLLAGVDAKDPRVLAALGWITQNWTIDRNPGFETNPDPEKAGQQGYYYYVYTLARTLSEYEALTEEPLVVEDADGVERDWRAELAAALLDRRGEDGWWINEQSERWEEGSRVLATSYALQALAEVLGRR